MSKSYDQGHQKAHEIFETIFNLSKIKSLNEDYVTELLQKAIQQVICGKYDDEADLEFICDKEKEVFLVINHNKTVISDPENDDDKDSLARCIEVPLSIAKKIKSDVEEGDTISEEITFEDFNKKDYIGILTVFNQEIRELEKQQIYQKYIQKIGEVVKARVTSKTKNGILLDLLDTNGSNVAAFMPPSFTNHRIAKRINAGDIIDVYIEEIKDGSSNNAQVIVSSVESKLIEKLFFREIPEIADGLIEIVKIARIPGERSKVAVKKGINASEGIQEIGAIVGAESQRIANISRQLANEKIDVILYSEELKEYIMNALSPAKVIDVVEVSSGRKDEDKERKSSYPSFIVVVPNPQHTLAIGKKGQNVMLASELVRAKLDILSQTQADERKIKYSFDNGNITLEEIQKLEEGKKLHSNFKRSRNNGHRSSSPFLFENNFNMDEFDADLAELRQKAQQTNDEAFIKQIASSTLDEDLELTLSQIREDLENVSDAENDEDPYSATIEELAKNIEDDEDYEKITETKMRDFKKDDDLSAGLENIDLSDLDDEDW